MSELPCWAVLVQDSLRTNIGKVLSMMSLSPGKKVSALASHPCSTCVTKMDLKLLVYYAFRLLLQIVVLLLELPLYPRHLPTALFRPRLVWNLTYLARAPKVPSVAWLSFFETPSKTLRRLLHSCRAVSELLLIEMPHHLNGGGCHSISSS